MPRRKKQFHTKQAQRLLRAVLGQAISDALEGSPEEKADARDFLFTERSDLFIMSQGIGSPESFREKLRKQFDAQMVSLWLEERKPVTFRRTENGELARVASATAP
jgi:hypothetical protein